MTNPHNHLYCEQYAEVGLLRPPTTTTTVPVCLSPGRLTPALCRRLRHGNSPLYAFHGERHGTFIITLKTMMSSFTRECGGSTLAFVIES